MRFVQSTGGRTGLPAPRRVRRRPFVQWQARRCGRPCRSRCTLVAGPSSGCPGRAGSRALVYDGDGQLSCKSGLADFRDRYRKSFGRYSPWADADSSALVMEVETALERALSAQLMHGGAKPRIEQAPAGTAIVQQAGRGPSLSGPGRCRPGRTRRVGLVKYGPGAPLGAGLPCGRHRTSTLVAVTPAGSRRLTPKSWNVRP